MITLIGLGPADSGSLSMAARTALRAATTLSSTLFVRTARHPAVEDLRGEGLPCESFDALYERADTFEEVYGAIAERVLAAARIGDVAYAVPGHPLVAEESVRRIIAVAREEGLSFRLIGSESFIEPALTALGLSVESG